MYVMYLKLHGAVLAKTLFMKLLFDPIRSFDVSVAVDTGLVYTQ